MNPVANYEFKPSGSALHTGVAWPEGGSIQGWIFTAEGNYAIDGQALQLCHVRDVVEEGATCPPDSPTVRSHQGLFSFEGIPLGTYRLEASPRGEFTCEPGTWTVAVYDAKPVRLRLPTTRAYAIHPLKTVQLRM